MTERTPKGNGEADCSSDRGGPPRPRPSPVVPTVIVVAVVTAVASATLATVAAGLAWQVVRQGRVADEDRTVESGTRTIPLPARRSVAARKSDGALAPIEA